MLAACTETNAPSRESESNGTVADTANNAAAPSTEQAPSKKEKSIDLYIIAGQSNAAGYTQYDSTKLSSLWNKYRTGVKTVIYSGRAESTVSGQTAVNEVVGWTAAKAGLGQSVSCMGAEVGMAKVLSEEYYNAQNSMGTIAGLIKFAHGGTSLLNNLQGENAASGNWVSPSYAAHKNIRYTGLTGGLYRGLLKQTENSVGKLKEMGYTQISIKGVFWMQGESDAASPAEYKTAFKYFASDLRQDLGVLMKTDLSSLPIIIGEISKTMGRADSATVAKNETFIAMQRRLAVEIPNTYTISSGQYEITHWDASTGTSTNNQDSWHWTTAEMFAIGELVGQCIIEKILNTAVSP